MPAPSPTRPARSNTLPGERTGWTRVPHEAEDRAPAPEGHASAQPSKRPAPKPRGRRPNPHSLAATGSLLAHERKDVGQAEKIGDEQNNKDQNRRPDDCGYSILAGGQLIYAASNPRNLVVG